MVSLTKALVAFILVGLFVAPIGPLEVMSYTVTDIDGSSAMDLVFVQAGSKTINLSIPQPFKGLSAQMNISGAPSVPKGTSFPSNVTVDVGADGTVDWAFNGTGYGPLGRQERFSDGSAMTELTVTDATDGDFELLVPKGAKVTSAGMTVRGVPTPTEHISSFLPNESLNASANRTYTVKGIDPGEIVLNSLVALKDVAVLQNKVDVNQSRSNGNFNLMPDYYSAQSFRINRTDPKQRAVRLYSVEIRLMGFLSGVDYAGLSVTNTSKALNYIPTSDILRSSYAYQAQIKNNYINFSFNPPLELEPDRVYSMELGDSMTVGPYPSGSYHSVSSGTNADSAYPLDGCFMQTSTDGGLNWAPHDLWDWAFTTHVDKARPITQSETAGINVDGKAPSISGTTLYFNQTPRYNSTGWIFNINDSLPLGSLYNMSAALDFNDAPDHVILDVGNDSVPELTLDQNLTGPVEVSNLDDEITSAVQTSLGQSKGQSDSFGNFLVPVPIKISSLGKGTVRLEQLYIEYDLNVSLPNLLDAMIVYQSLHNSSGTNPLRVPIKVTSSTAGVVHLSSLKLIYDGPPKQVRPFPSGLTMTEEGVNPNILALGDFFIDDFSTSPALKVYNVTTTPKLNGSLNITIDNAHQLSVDASRAVNWSGKISVLVNASDSSTLTLVSDPVNITVTNVNDAPVILSTPSKNATVGTMYRYNFTLFDSDSTSLTVWLEKAPLTMVLDTANRTITWTPSMIDFGKHDFLLKVSDGALDAQQNISLVVRTSGGSGTNHAPQVQNITDKLVMVSENLTVPISAYDPDLDMMEFYLVHGPANMTINNTTGVLSWRPEKAGNYSVTVRVSDGDLWADLSFKVTALEQSAAKPTVSIERPLSGEKISGVLTLLGKASTKGSKLVRVEYSIDAGQWNSTDLLPDGSWSADANTRGLSKGTHTLVVRATDARGLMGQTYTTFELKGRPSSSSGSGLMDLLPYFLILLVILALIILAVAMSKRRSKGGRSSKAAKTSGLKTKKDGKTKDAEGATGTIPRPNIDSAFLVYHDGRLITYASRSEIADLDATLQVIKDFVKASFRGDVGRLDALKYENMNIILERGVQMYLVVITPEGEDLALQNLRRKMRSFLGEVHDRYKHILKVWDGKYKSVQPIERMVTEYVKGKGHTENKETDSEEKGTSLPEEKKAEPPAIKDEKGSKRWDESPDLEDKGLSNIEKQKLLQDRLTRGEITEKEFERLSEKFKS